MALPGAHEGYEYQDLLTCYFILNEILNENTAEFIIDRKEYRGDKIDDLIVVSNNRIFKKQIKYSNSDTDHVLSKLDFSTESKYNLSVDTLYETWKQHPAKDRSEFRICLAWKEPTDEIVDVLRSVTGKQTFTSFDTRVYKIDGEKLWPAGKEPLSSWKRFKNAAKGIDRNSFLEFCDQLIIEVLMPKFSLDLWHPGEMEQIVVQQTKDIGIGIFPNERWQPESFILALLAIIKRSRSTATAVNTAVIFHELNIITDYGSIAQSFPVVAAENLTRTSSIDQFISEIEHVDKTLLLGEPGSGKSWFIENLCRNLKRKKIQAIRHFCYTDLDDALQKERIKLNVFYGNLVAGILSAYPHLKKFKTAKYASNLHELNSLLINIDEPTYIIIDGLDHIERIATFRSYQDISEQDRAIITGIGGLNVSAVVKIILTSQNIPELELIPGYITRTVPAWTEDDVKKMLKNRNVKNYLFGPGKLLSTYLTGKSDGNPLYLKYLLDEIKRLPADNLGSIDQLPDYSFNLSGYYGYLLIRQNLREEVPQVLSGVSFSLTKPELEEITLAGDHVAESLQILSPVLKLNVSQSGYSIYHESFRRYVLDQLRAKSIPIEQKIFRPLTEWFGSKDFFSHPKSYRYYLQFLFEGGSFVKMLEKLDHLFVTNSIIGGQSWELIEKNYKYLVKAASSTHNLPAIILLNEIDKIIATCQDPFAEIYTLYLEALGMLNGFQYVSDHLIFEGLPTVPYLQGLRACYLCDEHQIVAPWTVYLEFFKQEKRIEPGHFIYYVRGLLVTRQYAQLNKIAGKLVKMKNSSFFMDFRTEFSNYQSQDLIKDMIEGYPLIKKIIGSVPTSLISYTPEMLLMKADELLGIDHMHTKELSMVSKFFNGIVAHVSDDRLMDLLIDKFSSRNWFYNWVIYYVKMSRIGKQSSVTFSEVKEAFDYLKYDLDPFKGEPRVCDLYSLHDFIFESLEYGLSFVSGTSEWEDIIKTLVLVSDSTTTFLQKSLNGPLSTDKLFRLISKYTSQENLGYINQVFEELTEKKQEYYLHSDIAEYNFRLATQFVAAGNRGKAINYFNKGVEFILAYTVRKDMTLMDAIEGVDYYSRLNPEKGLADLKKVRVLVGSAVEHTDGRETNHFPVQWYERFLNVDFHKAGLYLLDDLLGYRYSWTAEECLVNFLCRANGTLNPVIEGYLALTFPINDAAKFVQYRLDLYDQLKGIGSSLAPKLIARLVTAMKPKRNSSHSDELIGKFNKAISNGKYTIPYKRPENNERSHKPEKKWYEKIRERPDFGSMSMDELTMYLDENDLSSQDVLSLSYLFDSYKELTPAVKELIRIIVAKNNVNDLVNLDLDTVFKTGGEVECYYLVHRFMKERGGWFEKFINGDAFIRAKEIDSEAAFTFLFELLPDFLGIGFNYVFSANLIRLLVDLKYEPKVIEQCWDNLLIMSSYRLPSQEDIKWEKLFTTELNGEELLICIMLSRFRAGTTERCRLTIDALGYLFADNPQKLIKPLKWFLDNLESFTRGAQTIVLQMISRQAQITEGYHLHFKTQLTKLFPTRYFIIDYIIARLFDLSLHVLHLPPQLIYSEIEEGLLQYFMRLNIRFSILEDGGIDLDHCFTKYAATYNLKYGEQIQSYVNRSAEQIVPHTLGGEYLLEILNTDCYREFKDWAEFDDLTTFERATHIDTDAISVYASSFGLRPLDLKKPFEFQNGFSMEKDIGNGEWIRIGHFERSLQEHGVFKRRPVTSYGGMVFSHDYKPTWPHSDYLLHPFLLWEGGALGIEIENKPIIAILQRDVIESFNIIWLNPALIGRLGLTTLRRHDGLVAVNEEKEVVLRMRTWVSEYVGDGFRDALSEEIPVLEGTELVINKTYFDQVCNYFSDPPCYFVVRRNEG